MKSKLMGLVIGGIAVVTIIATVGGWLDNDDGGKENPGNQGGSAPIVETGVDVMPLTEFNTDEYFENITVEIVEHFNNKMIYKVTNDSNVCYERLDGYVYFICDPLPGFPSLKEGEEYKNYFWFNMIPAYSVTYFLEDAFNVDTGKGYTDVKYYPFELGVDSYRIEFDQEDSRISDKLMQDGRDQIVFNRDDYDASSKKLGTVENKSNHVINFDGFVVFANGETASISNFADSSARGSDKYEMKIPPYGEVFKFVDSYTCPVDFDYSGEVTEDILEKECEPSKFTEIDCNSIYIEDRSSVDSIIQDFDLYINSWIEYGE